uniref:Uncharacterized protein TCIL3000_11_2420 n=1 Tax=Trypanosoma congolense (strain IL3000) TaxID=1068625 RepID=G0UZN1_TRYCI|nr:unnamed protein product [Trypanosoma congolense IL3000]
MITLPAQPLLSLIYLFMCVFHFPCLVLFFFFVFLHSSHRRLIFDMYVFIGSHIHYFCFVSSLGALSLWRAISCVLWCLLSSRPPPAPTHTNTPTPSCHAGVPSTTRAILPSTAHGYQKIIFIFYSSFFCLSLFPRRKKNKKKKRKCQEVPRERHPAVVTIKDGTVVRGTWFTQRSWEN